MSKSRAILAWLADYARRHPEKPVVLVRTAPAEPDMPWAFPVNCQCRGCGAWGPIVDEFTSPQTGLCAECSESAPRTHL
jgi:hypothetical protein